MTLTLIEKRYQNLPNKGLRKNHLWTEDERGIVRMFYDGSLKTNAMITGLIPGITIYAVKGQAAKMGLMQPAPPHWEKNELKYIENHCHEKSVKEMARALHRTVNAVKIKTTRMHLQLRIRDGWYDKMDVCEMLGVDHHKVQAWIDRGDLKARWHDPDLKPNAKGMAMWHIDAADLKSFISSHCQELQGRNIDLFSILDLFGKIKTKLVEEGTND